MNIVVTLLKMLGGLVLLIYGMNILSTHLKKIAGEKLKSLLKKATDNIFKGVITGIIVTIAVQSSAVVTVMVVGFVNAKILKLKNAIPVIMGANIGTTITAQILRLASLEENSIFTLLNPNVLASVFIIVGFLLLELKRKQRNRDVGQLLIGIGLLFTGLMTMVDMASSFSDLPILGKIMSELSNPLLGILVGAIVTAIVQSSAATVGILQAISQSGIITYASTIPIILGQNIGTCFTSLLSSIGTSKNAKRVAVIHLSFNLIGSIIFMIFIYSYQWLVGFSFWNKAIDMGGIANFHLIFNIVCTILLLPCIGLLEKLANLIVRDKVVVEEDDEDTSQYLTILDELDERMTNIPNVAIYNSLNVIIKMSELVKKNFDKSVHLLEEFNVDRLDRIQEIEDAVDKIDVTVANFLVKIGNLELTKKENRSVTTLLKVESELEKLADYVYKSSKLIESMNDKNVRFSDEAYKEIKVMHNLIDDVLKRMTTMLRDGDLDVVIEIQSLKDVSEIYIDKFKKKHIDRLKKAKCSVDSGISFIEILTTYEKIVGHCTNIAMECFNSNMNKEYVTRHEYLTKLYVENGAMLKKKFNSFNRKYNLMLKNSSKT